MVQLSIYGFGANTSCLVHVLIVFVRLIRWKLSGRRSVSSVLELGTPVFFFRPVPFLCSTFPVFINFLCLSRSVFLGSGSRTFLLWLGVFQPHTVPFPEKQISPILCVTDILLICYLKVINGFISKIKRYESMLHSRKIQNFLYYYFFFFFLRIKVVKKKMEHPVLHSILLNLHI